MGGGLKTIQRSIGDWPSLDFPAHGVRDKPVLPPSVHIQCRTSHHDVQSVSEKERQSSRVSREREKTRGGRGAWPERRQGESTKRDTKYWTVATIRRQRSLASVFATLTLDSLEGPRREWRSWFVRPRAVGQRRHLSGRGRKDETNWVLRHPSESPRGRLIEGTREGPERWCCCRLPVEGGSPRTLWSKKERERRIFPSPTPVEEEVVQGPGWTRGGLQRKTCRVELTWTLTLVGQRGFVWERCRVQTLSRQPGSTVVVCDRGCPQKSPPSSS